MDAPTWVELVLAALFGVAVGWLLRSLPRREPPARGAGRPQVHEVLPAQAASDEVAATSLPRIRGGTVEPSQLSSGADLAGRVVKHLSSLGRLGNDEVGRLGFTQKGMSEILAIRQGTLTKVLSRLEAARVIEVDRRHVRGEPRRLNVYRLTALGESVARDLRHRTTPPTASSESRPVADQATATGERT